MNTHEAIKILRNTAWLGTNEDREKTEQAVEVVAEALQQEPICCKDCKHWHGWDNGTGICHRSTNGCFWFGTDANDYCSFAERMESDEE